MNYFKKISLLTAGVYLLIAASPASAEIQCPNGWVKEVRNSVIVCVAQNQEQSQSQTQNNNQNQNVNQNVTANGGSSSSSSSSSSSTNLTINNPSPTPTTTIYIPQVIYKTQTYTKSLPATGLPETAAAASIALPVIGLALRKFAFKKTVVKEDESALSTWLRKNSF